MTEKQKSCPHGPWVFRQTPGGMVRKCKKCRYRVIEVARGQYGRETVEETVLRKKKSP